MFSFIYRRNINHYLHFGQQNRTTFIMVGISSSMRFHSSSSATTHQNEQEDDNIKSSRIISRILSSGTCIARHGRPIPENVNLDDLSKKLLSLQQQQESKISEKKLTTNNSGRKIVDSVSNIRRIMPPNAKAAVVSGSSSAASSSSSSTSIFSRQTKNKKENDSSSSKKIQQQQQQHSVDNLLLVTVQLKQTLEGNTFDERNVVVFPDSTIVVWGQSCIEEDCDVIADYLFYRHHHHQTSPLPVPENVEMEKINYRFVQEEEVEEEINLNEEQDEKLSATREKTLKSAENHQEQHENDDVPPVVELHEPGSVEIEDGVVTIYGPFSEASATKTHHYNFYSANSILENNENNNNSKKINNNEKEQEDNSFALEMLPIAMAVAQSARVDAIDHFVVAKLARDVRVWQKDLAFKGTLGQRFTLRDLRRSKAIVLGVMEEVSFALDMETSATSKLLRIANDLKKFRESYDKVADHFELERRLEALDSRVEAIDHSLVYLHEERHSVMSEQMTILIVILISMEIVVAVFEM